MSPEKPPSRIDSRQAEIKTILDAQKDLADPEKHAQIFIQEVDDFQQRLETQIQDPQLIAQSTEALLSFLSSEITPETIVDLSEKLHQALMRYNESIAKYREWSGSRTQVQSGESLSNIAMKALGFSRWNENPALLFTAVQRLHESRVLVNIDAEGNLVMDKTPDGPDVLKVGEYLDLKVLEDLKKENPPVTGDALKWYSENSPRYGSRLNRISATQSGEKSGENVAVSTSLSNSVQRIDQVLSPPSSTENPAALEQKAQALLQQQEQLRIAETQRTLEIETVRGFLGTIKGENRTLTGKVQEMRKANEGWAGYGHAIEPSNLIASIGGGIDRMLGGEGIKTGTMIRYELGAQYLSEQQAAERGVGLLLKVMRGSERQKTAPRTLREAWNQLERSGDPDFTSFRGSPEGHLFERTVVQGRESTRDDQAQYFYEKGMEIKSRQGPEEAEIYFQMTLRQFPESQYAQLSRKNAMSGAEKRYQQFTQFGDVMLRLDMLAVMAASGGVGALLHKSALGARMGTLISKYPQLSKVIPGVRAINASEKATRLTRLGIGIGNFALEVGKFGVYVGAAEKIGGEKAAYTVGMLCFFFPGLIHGFEKATHQSLQITLEQKGEEGLKALGFYVARKAGGPEVVQRALLQGAEREMGAVGQTVDRVALQGQVLQVAETLGLNENRALVAHSSAERIGSGEVQALDVALERVFTQKGASAFEQMMNVLRSDVRQILANLLKQASESGRRAIQAFSRAWEQFEVFLQANLDNIRLGSALTLNELSAQLNGLVQLFAQMSPAAQQALSKHLVRLREWTVRLEKHLKRQPPSSPKAESSRGPSEPPKRIDASAEKKASKEAAEKAAREAVEAIIKPYELIKNGPFCSSLYGVAFGESKFLTKEISRKLSTREGQSEIQKLLCELFGVNETATQAIFKKAYRRLQLQYHPDRISQTLSGDPLQAKLAEEKGKLLSRAYEFIKDDDLFNRLFLKLAA